MRRQIQEMADGVIRRRARWDCECPGWGKGGKKHLAIGWTMGLVLDAN